MKQILVLTKRQYIKKDLLDDRFGRFREIPLSLAQRGHTVRGFCLSYQHCSEEVVLDGQVVWRSFNIGRLVIPGLLRYFRAVFRTAALSDVIWAGSDSFYGLLGHLLARWYRIPMIFDLYDNFEFYLSAKLPVLRQVYRWTVRQSDSATCVSHPLSQHIQGYGKQNRVHLLENGVRKDLFRPMDKEYCLTILGLPKKAVIVETACALALTVVYQFYEILCGYEKRYRLV